MAMTQTLFDKLQKTFFDDDPKILEKLSPHEIEIRNRYSGTFTVWLENPTYTDKQIVAFMMREFRIERAQAYRDLSRIKIMLGNIRNAGKEWYRYMVVQMCQEAYNRAKAINDPKAMAIAADKLGKYTRCDQLDLENPDWTQYMPPNMEPSSDIEILGFKRIPDVDKLRHKLRKKFGKDYEEAIILHD